MHEISIEATFATAEGYVASAHAENVENYLKRHFNTVDADRFMANIRAQDLSVAVLQSINVFEGSQGNGLGSDTLEVFIEGCIELAADILILVVDLQETQRDGFDLVSWYERHGFEKTELISSDGGPLMIRNFPRNYIDDDLFS